MTFDGQRVVLEQIHLVEAAEVDGRRELHLVEELAALLDGEHRADRDAPRIDAVDAGGEHEVSRTDVGLERHVVELEPVGAAAAAAHHPLAAGAQDPSRRRLAARSVMSCTLA